MYGTRMLALAAMLMSAFVPTRDANAVFPGATWTTRTPQQVGLDASKLQELQDLVGGSGMIVRDGYQVWTWGNVSQPQNWASASKPALSTLLFLGSFQGRCTPQTKMSVYFTDGSTKDRAISFHQLANMTSGYSRGEAAGAAYVYNDHAINLYGYALYHGAFGGEPSEVFPAQLSFLQFQDSPVVGDVQFGRLLGVSIRDIARLGVFWENRGTWNGVARIPASYFDILATPVPENFPASTQDGPESWNLGTFGGSDNQGAGGRGDYSYNFWVNANGFWAGAPSDVFAAVGHGGQENCIVIPGLNLVAAGVGTWGHPSTAAVQLLLEAANAPVGVDERLRADSWAGIKSRFRR